MDLNREAPAAGPVISGYADGGFRVGDGIYRNGLWLDPHRVRDWPANPPKRIAELTPAMVEGLVALHPAPEFLLLGTGASLDRPTRPFVVALEAMGIGVEAMDSRAAARAWGILRQEERWIVAALLPC